MSSGRAMAGVITPVYLALQGFSAVRIGALFALVGLASAILSSLVGLVSDRVGRRPFLVALPLATAGAALVFASTRSDVALFLAASLGSFGRGAGAGAGAVGPYQPAESALVVDATPARHRNAALGRLAFGSSIGAIAGGLLVLVAPTGHPHGQHALAGFRLAFVLIGGLSALAGVLAIWIVEVRRAPRSQTQSRRILRFPRRSLPLLYRLWATNAVNGFAVGMFGPFVSYWFFRRFGASVGAIGVMFAVVNVASAFSTLSAAGLARRWGLVATVTVVRATQAILLVPLVLVPNFEAAAAIYLVRMTAQRIGLPLRQSYVLAMADPDERASVAAISNLPSQLTMAGSPLLAGYLFDEVSLALPFDIAAVFQIVNSALFWIFFRHAPPEEEAATPARTTPGRA